MSSSAAPFEPSLLDTQPDLWVVSKPAHWLTVPGRLDPEAEKKRPVLSEWIEAHHGKPWMVHRLDVQTSGVLLVARTAEAHRALNTQFQEHRVKKEYECLALGQAPQPVLRLNAPIDSKRALTQVEVVRQYRGFFHARVRIETGRQHQIRIHLAGVGHSLLGDHKYGRGEQGGVGVDRVALHAARLRLPDGRAWSCPLPEDFSEWLRRAE